MQLKFVTAFLFLFFFVCSFSQNISDEYFEILTDSIEKKTFTELYAATKKHFKNKDVRKSRIYALAALRKGKNKNDSVEITTSYKLLSIIEKREANFELAYHHTKKGIHYFSSSDSQKKICQLLLQKGSLEDIMGQKQKAAKNYIKAYNIAHKTNDSLLLYILNNNIALLKLNFGDYTEASNRFKRGLDFYENRYLKGKKRSDLNNIISSLKNLSKAYIKEKKYYEAQEIHFKGIDITNFHNLTVDKSYFLSGIGNVYSLLQENDKALTSLEEAKNIAIENNRKELLPYIFMHKGKAFHNKKMYNEALLNLLEVDKILDSVQNIDFDLQEAYVLLADAYSKLGKDKEAIKIYKRLSKIDIKNDELKINLLNDLYKQYDLKKIEQQVASLEEKVDNEKDKSYLIILVSTTLGLVLISFIIFYRKRQHTFKDRFESLIKKTSLTSTQEENESTKHIISDHKVQEILDKLIIFENKKLFRNNKYNLSATAKKLGTNSSYLSKIINTYKKQSFTEYLTDLRISDIVKRLQDDPKLRSFTMQSIAEEAGFRKAQSFSKAFKNHTGIYPSYFIKQIDSQNNTTS